MSQTDDAVEARDEETLRRMGYAQELRRRMGGFSNYAISLSTICVLAGGVTSFHLGYCSVGGASIGVGWPLSCLFSLAVALAMGQIASAYPTAGGLYHWASILGGRGWGWATAWFNLAGLVTVLAAINVGAVAFTLEWVAPWFGYDPGRITPADRAIIQLAGVAAVTASQAAWNHLGIRATTRLTDLSGYLILAVAFALTAAMLVRAEVLQPARLVTFTNYSGPAGGDVWPVTLSLPWLFALGLLLPAYTITGFDASAHTAEETIDAAVNVPRGIVRSVAVSGLVGWLMLSAVVMAVPDPDAVAASGERAFPTAMAAVLPGRTRLALALGIAAAQYLCGLACLTSTSRMAFAFARDGGLPFSRALRRVNPRTGTPPASIWCVAALAVLFTAWTPVYATITAVCTLFLYISYVVPIALGAIAYRRTWTQMGAWDLGVWYRPLAVVGVLGCLVLIAVGMQPPYERAAAIVGGSVLILAVAWFGRERQRFPGPPREPATPR